MIDYQKFIELLKEIFSDERRLSWRVKYAANDVIYKTIPNLSIENLDDSEFVSLLHVSFDLDNEHTNIVGIDCIFRWARRLLLSRIEEGLNGQLKFSNFIKYFTLLLTHT